MSSPIHEEAIAPLVQEDDPMADPEAGAGDEEEEGDVTMAAPGMPEDSSEEEDEDEDEERAIREGFIDDDEEEEDEVERESRRRHRKKRKRHHRHREQEDLEEDDLDLLEENTGESFKKHRRLTRLRRGRDSDSPPAASTSRHRNVVESSEDDLDNEGVAPRGPDIHNIWDDDRGGRDDDEDLEDIDDFIESDDEEEGGVVMDEKAREERRRQKRKEEQERRKLARVAHPELAGIDANAWDEIHDVFGDGHEYDWALEGEDEPVHLYDDQDKQAMNYQDVFEPSEIQQRLLRDEDDLVREQDTPERMQVGSSALKSSDHMIHPPFSPDDANGAAMWITPRLSVEKCQSFFEPGGKYEYLKAPLLTAVTYALKLMFLEEFEVPYIWTHKRDHISHFDPNDPQSRLALLDQDELWRIYSLGIKYRSFIHRRKNLSVTYDHLPVKDKYYEEDIRPAIDSVEMVVDVVEWLNMKYKDVKKDDADFQFLDQNEEEVETTKKRKAPSRISGYEVAKKSVVSKLADAFGIRPHEVVQNFMASQHHHFVEDQDLNPLVFAEQFGDPDPSKSQTPDELLRRARMILATELGKDPLLREKMRKEFKEHGTISVRPTDKGVVAIPPDSYYYEFKYLDGKRVKDLVDKAMFLHILDAEAKHLVTFSIILDAEVKSNFERRLCEAFASDSFSEAAKAWNQERAQVVREAIDSHLLPAAIKWIQEYVREEAEDFLASRYGNQLRERLNSAPFANGRMKHGDVPSVVAMSWGKGDPQRDAINIVYLDESGRMREHTAIDNLVDGQNRDEFIDLLRRRKPDVVVIGGFSMVTTKLMQRVKGIITEEAQVNGGWGTGDTSTLPVIYVQDDIARIYQNSRRAAEEFDTLPSTGKYCVGLARYTQNPLNEFAALGFDITAMSFIRNDVDVHVVPLGKLELAYERALVDFTNTVGVDINRAVMDPYYNHLLPFVCGLGPRKAQVLIERIRGIGGTLVNRNQFVNRGILTTKIFLNAASFLRIKQEVSHARERPRADDDNVQDPLDDTRIHPEDYELARKMATDALDLDEEDNQGFHASYVVTQIMADSDNERKLSELNLDDFAESLYESSQDKKRHTLNVIRDELLNPFGEQRKAFAKLDPWDIIIMLTGLTEENFRVGLVLPVSVVRITKNFVSVRLDCGIDGVINTSHLSDEPDPKPNALVSKGRLLDAVIVNLDFEPDNDHYVIEFSIRPSLLGDADFHFRNYRPDSAWNQVSQSKDTDLQRRKKLAETSQTQRAIKHPNFHAFNSAQAEAYLDKQHIGDVVVRPSSKGVQHLAVTWKVDEKLYQHIDVVESEPDPTGQTTGGQLWVDKDHSYADLDELIVNHVQAMARKVEELTNHDRFKRGNEDDLHLYLRNYCAANPAKSMYGFTLNRKKPGHFNLCFLANPKSTVQTWPVRVAPEAYYLFDAAATGVPELCDAFKVRHLHESRATAITAGGKTPYGAGTRTPARPGAATPGHMSVRQAARTPNPYSARTPNPYGGATPAPTNYPNAPPQPYAYGHQTPQVPPGMNPERAAMLQQAGGWNQGSGGWT